ncbi:HlyD family type I secretion periplasmic adaptor subunit [Methylomonas sp. DH-1]|uniref:HlyD family type I secretion periplasmic adaptor subunit n=1 Tax=Methylomonas sp. (strain DH-1) TaxID=1727196 RepID=UPI0007C8BE99|nr:HlyD family type I secretion periplasmic adaptor subunit [Methylomonas sp. DH-1]ANE57906.1 hypothetical protein AYM39_21665 [Methylomonas sp. DH-1]ANE57979.1 hypothetical protein AYM39_22100 [Methylomonas sp. DH-1]
MSLRYRWQAYAELWGRYRDTFRYFWRQRRELDSPPRSNDEAEFLPAALALQAQPVSPLGRGVAWLLMALVAATLAWAWFGEVDIIVNAAGKIIPSARTKTIASVDTASVAAIYVREGQFVRQSEPLLDLDSSAFDAERDKARANVVEARLQQARAQALIDAIDRGRPPVLIRPEQVAEAKYQAALAHLEGQYRDFTAKRQRLDGDIARYASALPLVAQQARDFQALAEAHDVAPHAYLEKEQARIELQGQLDSAKNQRAALIAETRKLAFDEHTQAGKLASDAEQDAARADAHGRLLKLSAPVSGTVLQLAAHTVGGVVAAAQPLLQIVPQDSTVEVDASLENKDIGFVQEGQSAEVKIDAFPYTKYGTVTGRVAHVSRDAIQDEKKGLIYSVRIALDQVTLAVDGHDAALSPGLSIQADIKTGRRRVIEYVLTPLLQHGRESLRER